MRDALLVIDMQVACIGPAARRHDEADIIARINALAGAVRDAGGLVIWIQHEGASGSPFERRSPGWALRADLDRAPADIILAKTACDAFIDTGLAAVLEGEAVSRLLVCGCATDFCVDTTIRAAAGRGYATVAVADAHTTSDRPHLSALDIIAHHHAIWRDFIAPGGPVVLASTDSLVAGYARIEV